MHCHQEGYKIVGISNQGGCSAINPATPQPYKSLESCIEEQLYTLELFPEIERIYFCPDFNGDIVWQVERKLSSSFLRTNDFDSFRKPGAGMLQKAMLDYGYTTQDLVYLSIPINRRELPSLGKGRC